MRPAGPLRHTTSALGCALEEDASELVTAAKVSQGSPARHLALAQNGGGSSGSVGWAGGAVTARARNNTVHDTGQGGITCDPCTDSTIESNTMTHVATNGIEITGTRITVHANTISDTVVAQHGGDADGMRFYGSGHRITDNTISDISADGHHSPLARLLPRRLRTHRIVPGLRQPFSARPGHFAATG